MNKHQNMLYANVLGLLPSQRYILDRLACRANKDGYCWPSQNTLATETGYDRRTVECALSELEAQKLIILHRRRGKATGYYVNLPEMPTEYPSIYPRSTTKKSEHKAEVAEEEAEITNGHKPELILANSGGRPGFEAFKVYRRGSKHDEYS